MLPVPPLRYGGTERVVALLADGLHRRGHEVTLFAAGDSRVECNVEPIVPHSVWNEASDTNAADPAPYLQLAVAHAMKREREFDVIHSHLEWHAFVFARCSRTPVVSTLHGRLDDGPVARLLDEFRELPLIAISDNQRRWHPRSRWVATIHNAVAPSTFRGDGRGGYLCFVGRVAPEKGLGDAIEVARRSGLRLRVAAKVRQATERAQYETVVRPAEKEGVVEFLGELGATERDELYGGAVATLMLGAWPEPFGLVAAESMSVGTPVLARRAGALVETVRDGVDGFIVDDVGEALLALERVAPLDREAIRAGARQRFSPERMVGEYESVYAELIERERPPARVSVAVGQPAGWTTLIDGETRQNV